MICRSWAEGIGLALVGTVEVRRGRIVSSRARWFGFLALLGAAAC